MCVKFGFAADGGATLQGAPPFIRPVYWVKQPNFTVFLKGSPVQCHGDCDCLCEVYNLSSREFTGSGL